MPRGASKRAAVRLYVPFHSGFAAGRIPFGEPRGRSFGQVRRDLLLQIDPSAFDSSAGYISRRG